MGWEIKFYFLLLAAVFLISLSPIMLRIVFLLYLFDTICLGHFSVALSPET